MNECNWAWRVIFCSVACRFRKHEMVGAKLRIMKSFIAEKNPALCLRITIIMSLSALIFACSSFASDPGRGLKGYPARFKAYVLLNELYSEVRDFEQLLRENHVAGVVPIDQLWLQGTEWQSRQHTAYAIPPREHWPAMVRTLRFVKHEVLPLIGPVEVQSGFRTVAYNLAAGGASRSKHMEFSALDLRPVHKFPRALLHQRLKRLWKLRGKQWDLGLGLYSGVRFHVDTSGYRSW